MLMGQRGRRALLSATIPLLLLAATPGPAQGQTGEAVVFTDDSPIASGTMQGLGDLIARGNLAEAARAVQSLLDEHADNVIVDPAEPSRWISVRARVHEALLGTPDLLAAYADIHDPEAERLVKSGEWARAAATRLLTPWGLEAQLRVVQDHIANARFHAAIAALREILAHPSRASLATDAARLAAQAASYVEGDAAWGVADAWAAQAGAPAPARRRVDLPEAFRRRVASPLTAQPEGALLDGLVPTPLADAALPSAEAWANARPSGLALPASNRRGSPQPTAWATPAIVGDMVLVNDGMAISAWDRLTLRLRYRVTSDGLGGVDGVQRFDQLTRAGADLIEPASVIIHGNTAIGTMGLTGSAGTAGERTIMAVDVRNGTKVWEVRPAEVGGDAVEGSEPHGAPIVEDGVAVVRMRRSVRTQRVASVALIGLDIRTGDVLWTRPLGSIGALPYEQDSTFAQGLAARDGVVYLVDSIGLTAAIEAATGRVQWLRTDRGLARGLRAPASPWNTTTPIVLGDRVITLGPDRRELLDLRRDTGAEIGRYEASLFGAAGGPLYLCAVGPSLAAITPSSVSFASLSDFALGARRLVRLNDNGARVAGAAWALGDTLAVPMSNGLLRIDPASGEQTLTPLPASGHIAVADGNAVVVGGGPVWTFVNWDIAASLLDKRLEADPADVSAAITLAELAYRGERTERVLPALDRALVALQARGNDAERTRLAETIRTMLEHALIDLEAFRLRDDATIAGLLDRLTQAVATPDERLALTMLGAAHAERLGDIAAALTGYQSVLASGELGAAAWRTPTRTMRGAVAADRNIEALLTAHGATAYAPFDAEAVLALASAETPEAAAATAKTFPFALAAPAAWLRAAERVGEGEGAARERWRLLRAGLSSARRLAALGRPIDTTTSTTIVGLLVEGLTSESRLEEAVEVLRIGERLGIASVTFAGVDTAPGVAADNLTTRLSAQRRPARIGAAIQPEERPQLLSGYVLRPIVSADSAGADLQVSWPDGALLVSPRSARLTWIEPAPAGAAGPAVVERWGRDVEGEPLLLRRDDSSAWLAWVQDGSRWIERIDLTDGTTIWRSNELAELFNEVGRAGPVPGRFVLPNGQRAAPDSAVLAMDGQTLLAAERSGRLVMLDATSGEQIWAGQSTVRRITDLDLGAGLLCVGGMTETQAAGVWSTGVEVIDARTGDRLITLDEPSGPPLWLRVLPSGDLVYGAAGLTAAITVPEGDRVWEIDTSELGPVVNALGFGGRLVLIDERGRVGTFDAASGASIHAPLALVRGSVDELNFVQALEVAGENLIGLSTPSGVSVIDGDGALVWQDALALAGPMLPAVASSELVVVVEAMPTRPIRAGAVAHRVHMLGQGTGRLESTAAVNLFAEPESVAIIDGAILITAGDATVVLRAAPAPE